MKLILLAAIAVGALACNTTNPKPDHPTPPATSQPDTVPGTSPTPGNTPPESPPTPTPAPTP